ncbi:MAG: hypothetical protein ACNY01_01430 [Desulfobacteria bacterium]
MDNRIFPFPFTKVLVKQFLDIRYRQDIRNIVNDPLHWPRNIFKGDKLENISQDTNSTRNIIIGKFPVKTILGAGTGGKKPVSNRLRVEIGKILF